MAMDGPRCSPPPRTSVTRRLRTFVPCLLALLAAPALAQTATERFERQLEQIQRDTRLRAYPDVAAGQRALFDYGAFVTLNYLSIDDAEKNNHALRQLDLVGYGHLSLDGAHEVLVRARASYRDFSPGDSFDGEGDRWIGRLEQAFYRFDLRSHLASRGRAIADDLSVQVGRQFVYWANGLTLAQYFDGVVIDARHGDLSLQLIAGVTPTFTVDFDSSRPEFDSHTLRGLYGGILSLQLGAHRPYAYVLAQRDYNPDDEVLVVGPTRTRFDYDSYYLGLGATGALSDVVLYAAEVTFELGHGRSGSFVGAPPLVTPVGQSREDIAAFAADLRVEYVPQDDRRTRLTAEAILATGDSDRLHTSNTFGGNRPGTDDHAFNALGLTNTGLAFAPAVSNLLALRLGGSFFPLPRNSTFENLQVGADLFLFGKFNEDAPIDEPTRDRRFLGVEPDFYLNWQVTSDVTLAARYGVFFPGAAIENTKAARHFFFTGLTISF